MLSIIKEYSQEVLDAKGRELNSLNNNNVFNWVDDHCQDIVSCYGSSQRNKRKIEVTLISGTGIWGKESVFELM